MCRLEPASRRAGGERQRTDTQVERVGYGREGHIWLIGELKGKLNALREEYQRYPSEDLARIIDDLTLRIENAREELRSSSRQELSSLNEASTLGCSLCYSATVDAYPLTSSLGVGAVAEAKFNSSCGNSGNTYAYAYARATTNSTTTTKTQEDPRAGSNVTSYAAATRRLWRAWLVSTAA